MVAGLRNPGPGYEGTRHNVGYEVLSSLARGEGVPFRKGPFRVRAEVAREADVVMVAPLAYMNQVGMPLRAALRYFKVEPEDLLVIHDDIDLALGRLRLQIGGGSGGHNGIRSIERHLATPGFSRLKVGVGRPPPGADPAEYVLHHFSRVERPEVVRLVDDAAEVVRRWLIDPARAQEHAAHRRPAAE